MNQQYTPKISVLVAIYNVGKYLNECLDSLKNQSLKEAEFILVDDCSTDNSLEICNQYAESDPRFKVVRHMENKGLLLVRKTGILNARGKFCIFLDGDDFLYSNDALEFVIRSADREKTDLIYFQRVRFSSSSLPVNRVFHQEKMRQEESRLTAQEFIDATFSHKQKLNWIITSKCFRREVLERVSTFIPEKHLICAEDAFLSFVSGNLIKNAAISKNKPIYAYRDDSGISTSKATVSNINRQAQQLLIIPWLRRFTQEQGLSQSQNQLIDLLRDRLILFFFNKLDDIEDEEVQLRAFKLLFIPEILEETTTGLLKLVVRKNDLKKIRRYDRVAKFIPWLRL